MTALGLTFPYSTQCQQECVRQIMPNNKPNKLELILLDRDGVINVDSSEFIKNAAQWVPIPGAIDAMVSLQEKYIVAICTNQSGLGRGLFDIAALTEIHDKLNRRIEANGGEPVDIFFCPHHPDVGCPCRKPSPELLNRAMQAYNISPKQTLYAGDSEKDLIAAENANCTPALILTGNGRATASSQAGKRTTLSCADLPSLARVLLQD